MPATSERVKAEWVQVTAECFVWGTWGVLEDAPGCWYLYPKPSDQVYGPFDSSVRAIEKAEEIRGD